jgi:hypothetical protein
MYSCRPKISIATSNDRWVADAIWTGEIAGHFAVGHFDSCIACAEAIGVGFDDVGAHGSGGQRIACRYGGRGGHKATARKRYGFCQSNDIGCQQGFGTHDGISSGGLRSAFSE